VREQAWARALAGPSLGAGLRAPLSRRQPGEKVA